jgi:hypothetical protein
MRYEMRSREISRRRLRRMGTGYGASRRQDRSRQARSRVTGTRQASGELTIGIVGPYDLVERIMLSGPAAAGMPGQGGHGPLPARRLVAAAYRDEQEAPEKVVRLGAGIDVCLFASRLSQEYAQRAGVLTGPATSVPVGGSALYAALLRACLGEQRPDLARASVDVLDRDEVEQAFGEIGLPARDVQVHAEPASAASLAAFHERLWRRGQTSVAFTCLPSVAGKLSAARVPVFALRPTAAAVRSALRTAALLGWCRRLEDAQLAVAVVEVPTLRDAAPRRGVPRQAREELRLTVNRFLVQEAQRIQATVSPIGEHGFLVAATRGSMAAATQGFREPPFIERARAEIGVGIEAGVGLGRTAQEAEAHARAVLVAAPVAAGGRSFALDAGGHALVPAPRQPAGAAGRLRGLETLARLADKLPASAAGLAVDAETASRLLSVTPRTARRLLHTLAEEGLAWPLPPSRTPQPGRPRQFYRLVTEKLEQD